MRIRIVFLLVLVLAGPRIAFGLEANLAESNPGTTQTLSVSPNNPLQVKIVNRLPNGDYSTSLVVRNVAVPPLPDIQALSFAEAALCTEITNLKEATSETEVPRLVTALEKAIDDRTCSKSDGQKVIAGTMAISDKTFTLQPGQELVLTVERQADDSKGLKNAVWTFVWTTGPRGEWRASYGFGFFEEDDEEFFTRPGEEDGTFVIHQEADRDDLAFAPAVFFTWAKESRKVRNWDYGPAGGLGFDLSKPVVFGGFQVTYNQNYTFNVGVVARPQTRLDGEYEVGQVLKEALSSDKLEDDSSYGVAAFVGLSFRFSKNPFKKAGGDGS